jgi:hypothetical protein
MNIVKLRIQQIHNPRKVNTMKLQNLLAIPAAALLLGVVAIATAVPAHADNIAWTVWSSATPGDPGTATGAIPTGISVSYSGDVDSIQANYPSWTPNSSYVGGAVGNAPPQSGGIVQMTGFYDQNIETITFSSPIVDPVMAIWSLGQNGVAASYDFNSSEPFSIVAGGPSAEYGGSSIYQVGGQPYNVYGEEGNGTIQFAGAYSSISFTTPLYENWYGFTVGEDVTQTATPEPETLSLLGLGLGALPFLRSSIARRLRARA